MVDVEATPYAEMLDDIGPYTAIVPAVEEIIPIVPVVPARTLPVTIIVPIEVLFIP